MHRLLRQTPGPICHYASIHLRPSSNVVLVLNSNTLGLWDRQQKLNVHSEAFDLPCG